MNFDSTEDLIEWVKDCPECAASKIEILQLDLQQYKILLRDNEAEIRRLENELSRAR
jgi:hypothetical protein